MNHCFNLRCTIALALGLMPIFAQGRQASLKKESASTD